MSVFAPPSACRRWLISPRRRSRFEWHIGQATTMASALRSTASFDDLGAQAADHRGAATGERGAAALGLEVPVDGLAADRGDQLVHLLRILGLVETGDLGRPHQQAAVVAGHGLLELLGDLGGDAVASPGRAARRCSCTFGSSSSLASRISAPSRPAPWSSGLVATSCWRHDQAVVAGRARGHDLAQAGLLRLEQDVDRQRHGEQVIDHVRRARAAAVPLAASRQARCRAPWPPRASTRRVVARGARSEQPG